MTSGGGPAAPAPTARPTLREMAAAMRDIHLQVLDSTLGTTSTTGSCLYACIMLQQAVAKFVGVPAVIRGGGGSDGGYIGPDGNAVGHYWVEATLPDGGVWIVDITADQFGGEPVTLARLDSLSTRYVAGDQALVDAQVAAELVEILASNDASD